MKLLDELIDDYDMVCDIKERYENKNMNDRNKIVNAATVLMECLENLIVTTHEIIDEDNYSQENDTYQKRL